MSDYADILNMSWDQLPKDKLLPFVAELAQRGFHGVTAVELPGEFCRRGGILDVFAPDWFEPVRIELFDDEVESIRRFDVATQRSLETLAEVEITLLSVDRGARGHLAEFLSPESWVLLIEPSAKEYRERGRFKQPDRSRSPAWAHPVIANGKLYIRDQDMLLCYDVRAQ